MDREFSPSFVFAFVLCTALFATMIQIDKANIGKRTWIAPPVMSFFEKGHAKAVVLSFKNVGADPADEYFGSAAFFSEDGDWNAVARRLCKSKLLNDDLADGATYRLKLQIPSSLYAAKVPRYLIGCVNYEYIGTSKLHRLEFFAPIILDKGPQSNISAQFSSKGNNLALRGSDLDPLGPQASPRPLRLRHRANPAHAAEQST